MTMDIIELQIKDVPQEPQKMTGGWKLPYRVIYTREDGEWQMFHSCAEQLEAERKAEKLISNRWRNVKIIKLPDLPPEPLETP